MDWTTFIVPCLIQKLVIVLDKIGSKGQDKNKNLCPSLNHRTTFCPCYNYKKYENTNIISLSLTDAILSCPVLPCSVMFCPVPFCPVFTVLQIKRTHIVSVSPFYKDIKSSAKLQFWSPIFTYS
jgi:hypothetical protein